MSRLEEIRKRYEAATPGPWETQSTSISGERLLITEKHGTFSTRSVQMRAKDADFIAHSREDIPWLVEIVEKLLVPWLNLGNGPQF